MNKQINIARAIFACRECITEEVNVMINRGAECEQNLHINNRGKQLDLDGSYLLNFAFNLATKELFGHLRFVNMK